MWSTKFKDGLLFVFNGISNCVDPWWWIVASFLLFAIALLRPVPLTLMAENRSFSDHLSVYTRRVVLALILGVVLILPLLLYVLFGVLSNDNPQLTSEIFKSWAWDMTSSYFGLPLGALIVGFSSRLIWDRYGLPWWSNFARQYRVKQREDKPADARDYAAKMQPKTFDPEKYFVSGKVFYGLDSLAKPVYLAWSVFVEVHHAIIGPTRYGKGVELGVLFTQAIRAGCAAFYIDPKGDDNMPYILQNEAKKAGRPFVYLDLNAEGKGNWHPFKGGTARSRRSRIIRALGLASGGTDADVYKSNERALLDEAMAKTDGSVKQLFDYVKRATEKGALSTLRDTLAEWVSVSTFTPPSKRRGHSIEESLKNGAVVYVRGSINDPVIKLATRVYISELISEIPRLNSQRPCHVTVGIDELKFLASEEIATALATIAGARCNLLLCAQSLANLESPDDHTIRGDSLVSEFVVNTQVKLLYKAADRETAEFAEKNSGTQWLRTAKMEKLETNTHGGEQWGKSRTLESTEHAVISSNVMLNLPPRVAAGYLPSMLPTIIYTAWVSVDKSFASWVANPQVSDDNSVATEVVLPDEKASHDTQDVRATRSYADE